MPLHNSAPVPNSGKFQVVDIGAATLITLAVLSLHSTQAGRQRELQREAPAAEERAAAASNMRKLSQHISADEASEKAAADAAYENTPQRKELRALEDADRAAITHSNPSTAAPASTAR
jgi:hypothetical protein